MFEPRAFHLPGIEVPSRDRWKIGELGWETPVLDATLLARTWDAIEVAAAAWRSQPSRLRIDRLATAAAAMRTRGPGNWEAALQRSSGLSPAGLEAAWNATFLPHTVVSL